MRRETILQIIAVTLCLSASWISYKLLAKHVTGTSGSAWFDAGCVEDEAGSSGCATVLASPHSYWPPKRADEPAGTPHIPVAFLGLIYFSSLAVWLIGVGSPSRQRRRVHWIPLLGVGAGLALSARFVWVMFSVIGKWCPWCLITHIMNLVIAVCVVMLWPRKTRTPVVSATIKDDAPAVSAAPYSARESHPSWRRVLGTIGVVIVVTYGNYGQGGMLAVRRTQLTLQQCLGAVARIKGDTPTLIKNWNLQTKREIAVRSDDPVRAPAETGKMPLPVVVFSDFKCPSCKRFAELLDDKIVPLFDGRLHIVFKHYPIDQECNKLASRTLHPHACSAARIAEAARMLGGNESFWQAHDLLFEMQSAETRHSEYEVATIAKRLGLDESKLIATMQLEEVGQRINEDAALAKTCGVNGTPAVFVNGKRVDTLALNEIGFWDAIAESYWRKIKTPRPPSTRPK